MERIEDYNEYTWKHESYQLGKFWKTLTIKWFRVIQKQGGSTSDNNDSPSGDNDDYIKSIWGWRDPMKDEEDMIPSGCEPAQPGVSQ